MIFVEKKDRTKRLCVHYGRLKQDGIIANPKKVASVVEWDRPTTNIDVRSFLCLLDTSIGLQRR